SIFPGALLFLCAFVGVRTHAQHLLRALLVSYARGLPFRRRRSFPRSWASLVERREGGGGATSVVAEIVSTRDSFAPLGDIPSESFRRQLHEVADWIADYRASLGERIVALQTEAG